MAAPINLRTLLIIFELLLLCTTQRVESKRSDVSVNDMEHLTSSTDFVLLYFYTRDCPECGKADIHLDLLAESEPDLKLLQSSDLQMAYSYHIRTVPALLYFRHGLPIVYDGVMDAEELLFWLENNRQSATKVLNEDNFEHDTQASTGATTGDWFIQFYKPSCSKMLAIWDTVASRLQNRAIVAKVDTNANEKIRERFSIVKCPTFILFHHGKMYTYNLDKQDVSSLVSFAEGWFRNEQGVSVPRESTPFDAIADAAVEKIKEFLGEDNHSALLALFAAAIVIPILAMCGCCYLLMDKKQKSE